ncbi:type I-F CRISPR-associated protein Csy1 [Vibrio mangrovi]|uniref:CRISPR-associated protein Csy1 n=1 Tax=Vibrio mangrovi TaxID=474394 RepID=A0A1Y6IZ31_9VIBR|nr:type I-F CRISPR-associated protein Csy1 [Vibrio mangrovi]MDW6005271.1 type I-F CRISPR-associated protein Csy1 [Vibrio mangrovi]SMS02896.1 CRISPR-associated protein Csy1 [Vibrio mangrovi]
MLSQQIERYIHERYLAKQEALDKTYAKARQDAVSETTAAEVETEYAAKREKLQQDFQISHWLDSAAQRASQISMATHAIKFTHSGAKGSNLLASNLGSDPHYLDTSALKKPAVDVVGNAAALDVARLLQLTDEHGTSLFDYLKQENTTPLQPFTTDETQLSRWTDGLKQALHDQAPSSHTLGKQIYFPIGDNQYHLLVPLYSSSLSQAFYDAIHHSRYSQEMKAVRDARKNQQPHNTPLVAYPDLAVTIAGGSKPQNVSQLNSGRGGRNYLFSARPPVWQTRQKPPLTSDNIFTHPELRYLTRDTIRQLRRFLTRLNQQQTDSNQRIRNYIRQQVDEVIDQALSKAGQWQQLPARWSDQASDLPLAQRRWLDPEHPQWDRHDQQWQQELAQNFGLWLKDSLNYHNQESFVLGNEEVEIWKKAFLEALQEAGQ